MSDDGRKTCMWVEDGDWSDQVVYRVWQGTGHWFWRCFHELYCTRCGLTLPGIINGHILECPSFEDRD